MGASGYTGAELLRLLRYHPQAEIRALTADRHAGKPIGAVFPHLAGEGLPDLVPIGEVDWRGSTWSFADCRTARRRRSSPRCRGI